MNKLILHTTLFSSLLCASSLLYAEEGILALTTDPPNAEIYVDGQLKTNLTPVVLLHLPAGKHLIEAKKDDKIAKLEVLISDNVVVHNKMVLKAKDKFRDPLRDGGEGPEMVIIPASKFRMGDIHGRGFQDEQPVHEVSVKSFAMSRYEITFDDYDRFADPTTRPRPSGEGWGRGNRPVINVFWDDATAYAEWLGIQTGKAYRLPTEAEWEYAARAGTETEYWWGNEIGTNRTNCGGSGSQWSGKQTAPVGSFATNPFGLYDILGNVWEWTCSVYKGEEQRCADKHDDGYRLLRGGSWSYNNLACRSAYRFWVNSDHRKNDIGLRVVCDCVE